MLAFAPGLLSRTVKVFVETTGTCQCDDRRGCVGIRCEVHRSRSGGVVCWRYRCAVCRSEVCGDCRSAASADEIDRDVCSAADPYTSRLRTLVTLGTTASLDRDRYEGGWHQVWHRWLRTGREQWSGRLDRRAVHHGDGLGLADLPRWQKFTTPPVKVKSAGLTAVPPVAPMVTLAGGVTSPVRVR